MRLLVTGASGLLGRALLREFAARPDWEVTGLAWSRSGPGLERLDLTDPGAVSAALARLDPQVIVHAAAERRPDVSERDPGGTWRLNVGATGTLARWAGERDRALVYLSTDYVFDGSSPPYGPGAAPKPLNAYGRSKLAGEAEAAAHCPRHLILRVPILYGPSQDRSESAVTVILENLRRDARAPMDHWAIRYPTYTPDVARVIAKLLALPGGPPAGRVLHWSGNEPMTKYAMAMAMITVLGLEGADPVPVARPAGGTPRPRDCHLDCAATEALLGGREGPHTPFASGIRACAAPWIADWPRRSG